MNTNSYERGSIALLVGGQNFPYEHIDLVFNEVSKFNWVRKKRLYGD